MRDVLADDPPLPLLLTRSQAREAGLTDRQISYRIDTGRWQRARRGLLVTAPAPPLTSVSTPSIATAPIVASAPGVPDVELAAALRSTRRDVVVGHAHAARLWGLPQPLGGWGRPVLLATSGPTRNRRGIRVLTSPLADADVVRHRLGIWVTSPSRTVSDCLRSLRAPDAIAIADAAARRLVSGAAIAADLDRFGGWPGVVQARRLAALVDGRRETALESWSALAFDDHDVPPPCWQVDIRDGNGFVGRGDSWWDVGLVGEADGRSKYLLAAQERGGADASRLAQVLDAERLREQRMRRAGLVVVRWGASDVLNRGKARALAEVIRAELAARRGGGYTAVATVHPVTLPS